MGKRAEQRMNEKRKINKIKVLMALIVLAITIAIVVSLFILKDDNKENKNEVIEEEIPLIEIEEKTVEEIVAEFGGSIIEKVKPDTCYVSKNEKEYTVYSDGEILEGRIAIWDGKSTEPKINDDGSIDIILPGELKWVADKVISGEKNFSGVKITLKEPLDFGARKTENGWEGENWTSIVGFLDELPEQEENKNKVKDDSIMIDDSVNVIQENLKRFAGIFNGNNLAIRGLKIDSNKDYQGLFGFQAGNVENLIIKNSYIKGNSSVGAIAGLNTGVIFNCKVINTEVVGDSKVGGLVGNSSTGSKILTCDVEGIKALVKGTEYVGGAVGYTNNNVVLENITNNSKVESEKFVGGISGISFYGTTLMSSKNNGRIIGSENVGGLIGYSQAQIEKSYVSDISVVEGNINVGGLVGLNHSAGDLSNSYNKGKVIGNKDVIGGLVGTNNSNISNCYNTGRVDARKTSGLRVGGICGQNMSDSFITSVYNIGDVLYNESAEGIVGIDYGTTSNAYYLDTALVNENADRTLSKTGDEMKSSILTNLGELFIADNEGKNNGYPILKW